MSGVGKTSLARMLRHHDWFHYSVDYRIGTRYMGEHIVDNFKREAMKNPFLRDLLRTDLIYISSNITFENLDPLSTYLGKPGNLDKGGISFDEYRAPGAASSGRDRIAPRRAPVREEVPRDLWLSAFHLRSWGSLCEVVDADENDPVLRSLAAHTPCSISAAPRARRGADRAVPPAAQADVLARFLERKWAEYKAVTGTSADDDVDPDDFLVWGFGQLLHHRIPLYEAIARQYGYAGHAADPRDRRPAGVPRYDLRGAGRTPTSSSSLASVSSTI